MIHQRYINFLISFSIFVNLLIEEFANGISYTTKDFIKLTN